MTRLALVRHGQTDWNLAKRIQGSTDIPLNDTGRAEARETAATLVGEHFDEVLTSPLSRARETAEIIAAALGLPQPTVDAELVERRYGDAEGMDYRELHERFPSHIVVPGRETHREVQDRVRAALIRIAESRPGESLVVVCHGGVISSLVRYATGGDRPLPDERIPNGSVHYFSYTDGELRLDEFNGEPVSELALQVTPEAQ
ncbi:histidine phosphatase family protein [Subtercola sp. Z020]|uniref:histidine phosphatase family protein n=1 Tax=Subtercola sp. Z020 TaxID=2080582 RepID=UPI000CE75445|nr:histidine phosphatase family protein [Subtercola sp. Z020]PPF85536.1 histidine phosphatase family protein [Subtercola sp. Z020]